MSTKFPGGLVRSSGPTIVGPVDGEGGSAPGVWTLQAQLQAKAAGTTWANIAGCNSFTVATQKS